MIRAFFIIVVGLGVLTYFHLFGTTVNFEKIQTTASSFSAETVTSFLSTQLAKIIDKIHINVQVQ